MIYKNFLLAVALIVLSMPQDAAALEATKQTTTTLNENLVLFTIEYEFGFLNAELWMPIAALGVSGADTVGFMIETEEGQEVSADAKGIVLSNAVIEDEKYYVPAGERTTFTLAVLLVTEGQSNKLNGASLQVSNLPYEIKRTTDTEPVAQQLNKDQLEGYRATID